MSATRRGCWIASVDLRPHARRRHRDLRGRGPGRASASRRAPPGSCAWHRHASPNPGADYQAHPVERALDVGTGCGIQTFHLLAHARHVTATDISGRALAFTRFNLLLNAQTLNIDPQNPQARVSLREVPCWTR